MKRNGFLLLAGLCLLWGAVAQAVPNTEAAQLASGACSAAHKAHPFLVTLAHIIFIVVMVCFGAVLLRTLIDPRNPPR